MRANVVPRKDDVKIYARFHFRDEPEMAATTGVAGNVADFILPSVGDFVWHQHGSGLPSLGKVVERFYIYRMEDGTDVDGSVQVTVVLDRVPPQQTTTPAQATP